MQTHFNKIGAGVLAVTGLILVNVFSDRIKVDQVNVNLKNDLKKC